MLKTVKILVFSMGALIFIGVGLLGYGLYGKARTASAPIAVPVPAGDDAAAFLDAAVLAQAPALPGTFGMLFLDEPEGTVIKSMSASDTVLAVELVGGPQARPNRIVIIDLHRGTILGRINLGSAL